MPVFARTKLVMEEPCITLRPRLEFTYSGPNPQDAYEKLIDIMITVMKVSRENIQEKKFVWERTKIPETFEAGMEVIKEFDKFSYMQLSISMKGSVQPSKEFGKEGSVSIVMEGYVRTEYPQDSMWERSFFYEAFRMFYHKIFYQDQRKKYIDTCRDWMLTLQNELKSFFNILPRAMG